MKIKMYQDGCDLLQWMWYIWGEIESEGHMWYIYVVWIYMCIVFANLMLLLEKKLPRDGLC